VRKASEYRQHAQECRDLAKQMRSGAQREQLLAMANTWDALADERDTMLKIERDFGSPGIAASTATTSRRGKHEDPA
jgi:hypothetical protein